MRKKLDPRFPASRIKKIMQADEDVGKIALAVPVLVSKALELFLQDLCDRTYGITLQRGVKTMSSSHLKQCVHSFNVYDFLRDIMSKVPDIGGTDAGSEDRSVKRRKTSGEDNDSDDESKRSRSHDTTGYSNSIRGRGRGRSRGRGARGTRGGERDSSHYCKYEDDPGTPPRHDDKSLNPKSETIGDGFSVKEQKETVGSSTTTGKIVRNFDLNLDWNENGDVAIVPATTANTKDEIKHEEYPGWSLSEMDKTGIDLLHVALSSRRLDEEEEDYDNEEG